MGRERTWSGQYLYIYIAYLISIALVAGCSTQIQVRRHLRESQELLQAGDYPRALIENQKALQLRQTRPPADRILFNMALIYASPKNPKRDYQQALEYFDRLAARFPDSAYTEIGRVWRLTVEENRKLRREVTKRRRLLKHAQDGKDEVSKLLDQHNIEIEQYQNENRRLQDELEKLNQIILESKRVDIEIEAKKRQSTR